ncbi:uncharacterized protein LOC132257914 [Phlebotomus argentipes]|uniref:uncharacterized protein LOC132257914 n=1 Tax=Phlebotomus argentipes TaxID=94469 RepID=UPI0028933D45|nr:uncharacterized protein LOC132257914 [Phlebotomus argentipes]
MQAGNFDCYALCKICDEFPFPATPWPRSVRPHQKEIMWNQRNLNAPPLVTLKSTLPAREMPEMRKSLEEARKCLSVALLGPPAARISRSIARMSQQFRSTVGFKSLRKMNIALLRAKEVKIVDCVENVLGCFPTYAAESQGGARLPSRQYIEYMLLRMMGLTRILCRVVFLSKEVARFFLGTINRGHFIDLGTMILATVAEVWKHSKDLCRNTVLMYNRLFSMQRHFARTESVFLKGFSLPQRLDQWLGKEWKETLEEVTGSFTPSKPQSQFVEFSDEEEDAAGAPEETQQPVPMELDEEETGIVIDRQTLSSHTPHNIFDKKSLMKFLQDESKYRKLNDSRRLTKLVSHKKWQKFQEKLNEASKNKSKADLMLMFNANWTNLVKD